MKKVKMINKVPLTKEDGSVYHPAPGTEVVVSDGVCASLLKGGDAEEVAATKPAQTAQTAEEKPVEDAPTTKKTSRKSKNRGAAPENK